MKKRSLQHFTLLTVSILLIASVEVVWPARGYGNSRTVPATVDIVGKFAQGDGLCGNTLVLNADNTFKYSEYTDAGPDANWSGTYRYLNNVITLLPSHDIGKSENGRKILDAYENEIKLNRRWHLGKLMPIRWGSRLYLLSNTEMRSFCNDINLGEEPRGTLLGSYFIREFKAGEWNLPAVTGFPQLPKRWRTFLLPKPVTGKVMTVVNTYRDGKLSQGVQEGEIIAVTIGTGSQKGLKPGMVFYVQITPLSGEAITTGAYAVIREVKPNKCLAELVLHSDSFSIKEGTSVSTRLETSSVEEFQHPHNQQLTPVK